MRAALGAMLAALLLAAAQPVFPASITITSNRLWSSIANGSGPGGQPSSSDTITINSGITLTVDVANGAAAGITVGSSGNTSGATLRFASGTAAVTVAGPVTLGAGTGNRNGSIDMASGGTLSVRSIAVTNLGTWTPGTGTVVLTANNTLPASAGLATFNNLSIAVGAGNTTALAQNTTVNGTLSLVSGTVSAGTFTLVLGASGTVSRTGGHVIGRLQKNVPTGSPTVTFEIGDAGAYAPVSLAFASVTVQGNVTASTTGGDHPDLANSLVESARSVNRYWILTNSGTAFASYSATLNYASGDLDGGTTASQFVVGKADSCDGSNQSCSWTLPALSGTPSGTSASASGMTAFSGFAVGHFRVASFLVEAATGGNIPDQTQLVEFAIRVTAKDINGNTVTPFNGTVDITSNCGMAGTRGTTDNFVNGVLDPAYVTIANVGDCTLTATLTGGTVSGTSNTFLVSLHGAARAFDACEYDASSRCSPGTAGYNRLYTKLALTAFNLDLVALRSNGTLSTSFNQNVDVSLLAYKTVQSSAGADNCPTAAADATIALGTVNFNGGRPASPVAVPAFTSAYRDVRVKVVCGAGTCKPGITECATDNFAVRPAYFSVTSTDATQTGTSGAPVITTGANFNLTAAAVGPSPAYTAVPGYNGTPAVVNAGIVGSPNAGTIGGSFAAASDASGIASGNGFFYSEVGNFGLNTGAVIDASYTSVDQSGDCVANDTSTTLNGGKYGCSIGSLAVPWSAGVSGFGRFIPANFDVTVNTPVFTPACTSNPGTTASFTYVGQLFNYGTAPVLTVTARNGTLNGLTNATTTNYAGAYVKLSNSTLTPNTSQADRYSRFDQLGGGSTPALDTSALPAIASDPAISFTAGVGTLTFSGGGGLMFTRGSSASTDFNADIGIQINVLDGDGVAYASNPLWIGQASAGNGISFSGAGGGKSMRFGRLFVPNSYGSEKLDLAIPVEAQYWDGAKWIRNASDSCTSFTSANVALGNYAGGLNATNLGASHVSVSAMTGGLARITLTKPSPAPACGVAAGCSVGLAVNLGTTGTGTLCPSWTATATGAGLAHLRGDWCSPAGYAEDPAARVDFGVSRGRFILNREMY